MMDSDESIHTLDTCKFNTKMKCLKAICPAYTNGACAFDIGDVVMRKAYEATEKAIKLWQSMSKKQKIDNIANIIKKLT